MKVDPATGVYVYTYHHRWVYLLPNLPGKRHASRRDTQLLQAKVTSEKFAINRRLATGATYEIRTPDGFMTGIKNQFGGYLDCS